MTPDSRWLSVSLAVALAAVLSAEQQPFRSGASTVAVYATVTDATGRLVPDLSKDDFEIRDNGQPQPISVFSNDIQPITVVMMLDRSGSQQWAFRLVEAAAEQFVRRLLPGDKARIGSFAQRVQIDPEDFTNDQEQLVRILRTQLQEVGPTPLWNAVSAAITSLLPQDGRRVVLVFTDGGDNPMNFRLNNQSVMDVVKRAQQENVMVYAVGLEARDPRSRQMPQGGMGGGGFGGGLGGSAMGDRPDAGLPLIAGETGGGYFELTRTDELGATFSRVADELHRQYALGFEPAKLDGKSHKLDVRVKKPGMKVRARKNYIAAKS